MLEWIKSLFVEEITAEDVALGIPFRETRTGRPFWEGVKGPDYSGLVRKHGAITRIFKTTRHDN